MGSGIEAMTDWQQLISSAFTEQFLRTGRMLSFRLARGDLAELAGQVAECLPALMLSQWAQAEGQGFLTLRCLVRCEPLDKAVVVDEWVKTPALAMAQATRRVNADIIRSERLKQ